MQKFSAYIEYLLMTQHYCYVPGHGAYMLADESASTSNTPSIGANSCIQFQIKSPCRKVLFSPLHNHDDGILANLLMEAEGMSYDEACRYIERQIPTLTEDFIDKAVASTDTENFGFDSIYVETWKGIESRLNAFNQIPESAVETTLSSDVIAIPKVWLKRVAMVALVVLFFFTNFIGLNDSNTQLASIINVTMLRNNAFLQSSFDTEEEDEFIEDDIEEAKQIETFLQDPETSLYFIIVASTVSEDEARSVYQRYTNKGYKHMGILAKPNLYRVFAGSFTQKEEAVAYLHELRQSDSKLQKAWMLPVEGKSLSYIIKDIYNDDKLSMELSHPNKRTERDQG